MSISGPKVDQIPSGKGKLILSTWTSTMASPSSPSGASSSKSGLGPSLGGQTAVVGSFTPFGDYEQAGTYFVEVSGTSGPGALRLAVDGNVTTLAVPEPSTWAMFGIGFAGLAAVGLTGAARPRERPLRALTPGNPGGPPESGPSADDDRDGWSAIGRLCRLVRQRSRRHRPNERPMRRARPARSGLAASAP